MNEQEAREKAVERKGDMLDHFEIEAGSAAKGVKVSLKTYYNAMDIDEAQTKIENTLKIRQYLIDKQIIQ